jgi:hypothetical protein
MVFLGVAVIMYEVSFNFIFMNFFALFFRDWVVIYTPKNHVNFFSICENNLL